MTEHARPRPHKLTFAKLPMADDVQVTCACGWHLSLPIDTFPNRQRAWAEARRAGAEHQKQAGR